MRDIIIGLGNLCFRDAEPFLASLWHVGFRGDVCLLVYDVDVETRRMYRELGVIVADGRPFIRPDRDRMNSRFFMILDFLAKNYSRYDRVMLSDVRDVIFQTDPFSSLGAANIIYGAESKLIRDCPINGAWIMQGYGYGIYENIRDSYISCAGTTIGTTSAILQYLTLLVDEMSTCKVLYTNIDQGIHNYLVHMRPVTNSFLDKDSRAIATLHHVQDNRLAVTQRGIELDGALVPVIHQWDRRPVTSEYVRTATKFRVPASRPRCNIFRQRADVTWSKPTMSAQTRTVVVYFDDRHYNGRLAPFLRSLHAVGFDGNVIILTTALAAPDQAAVDEHRAEIFTVPVDLTEMPPDNAAHVAFGRQLAEIASHRVFFFSDPAVEFAGDPFEGAACGVSLFAEGPKLVSDCPATSESLHWFGATVSHLPTQQIVSDRLVCGDLGAVRTLYLHIADLIVANPTSLERRGALRGALNVLAWIRPAEGLDVTVRPNGSCAFFEAWPAGIDVMREPVLQVGGATPAIIIGDPSHTTAGQ